MFGNSNIGGHFKEVCKYCKIVISQCRCWHPEKLTRYDVCENCKPMLIKTKETFKSFLSDYNGKFTWK